MYSLVLECARSTYISTENIVQGSSVGTEAVGAHSDLSDPGLVGWSRQPL